MCRCWMAQAWTLTSTSLLPQVMSFSVTIANQTACTRKFHAPVTRSVIHPRLFKQPPCLFPSRVETEDGDYAFCFDNTFSSVSEKIIFFELILDNMDQDVDDADDWKEYVHGTDMLDMKLEDIMVRRRRLDSITVCACVCVCVCVQI